MQFGKPPTPAVPPFASGSATPPYTLSGFVLAMNGAKRVYVAGAVVRVVAPGQTAAAGLGELLTDSSGAFRVSGLGPGLVSVQIAHEDYRTATATTHLSTNTVLNLMLLPADGAMESLSVGETVSSNVSSDDPLCDTADPNVEELEAPCKTFEITAPATGSLFADLAWTSGDIFMELLTPSLGKCCRSPLRLPFAVVAGATYTVSVGFHGTTVGGPIGKAPFELTTSLAP